LAEADPFWSGLVVPARRCGNVLVSRRYTAAFPAHQAAAERLIEDKLAALIRADRTAAVELIDLAPLVRLAGVSSVGVDFEPISSAAALLRLPVSSSHGDFFAGNMVWRLEQVALIDWDSYRAHSSFVLDALHFRINALQRQTDGKSWTRLIFDEALKDEHIGVLASRFDTPIGRLLLVYALDRISRETTQEGGTDRLQPAKLAKYVVLLKALSAFSERSNG
jgi:hypothetical protein